jgi:3-oxoacyl-[acyl-carrier protein] reductase
MNILITGASRGIGRETAITLAKDGHRVLITARSEEKLDEIAAQYPQNIISIPADISQPEGTDWIVEKIKLNGLKIDILINNAGLLINKPFMETTDKEWLAQFECNLLSGVRLIRCVVPEMKEGGHILNISSMGGYQGSSKFPGLSAYSASKGALAILSECLAIELSSYSITVNCLCLGAVQTEMLQQAFPGFKAPVLPIEMGAFISNFALTGQKFFNGKVLPVSLTDPE